MKFLNFFLENYKKYDYSCLMLDCSNLYDEIVKIQDEIETKDLLENRKNSLEHQTHITILYGLLTRKSKQIFDSIPNKSIRYKIKGLSLFENEDKDVLKFTIESDDLNKLNKKIRNNFENENSYPDYNAHMTIAYLKSGTGKKYLKLKSSLIGMEFIGNILEFSSINGQLSYKLLSKETKRN